MESSKKLPNSIKLNWSIRKMHKHHNSINNKLKSNIINHIKHASRPHHNTSEYASVKKFTKCYNILTYSLFLYFTLFLMNVCDKWICYNILFVLLHCVKAILKGFCCSDALQINKYFSVCLHRFRDVRWFEVQLRFWVGFRTVMYLVGFWLLDRRERIIFVDLGTLIDEVA